jgi:hypothetical protein
MQQPGIAENTQRCVDWLQVSEVQILVSTQSKLSLQQSPPAIGLKRQTFMARSQESEVQMSLSLQEGFAWLQQLAMATCLH